MLILSASWLIILIGFTLIHWVLPSKLRGWWIVTGSAAFLAWFSPVSLVILSALTGLYYTLAARKDSISGQTLTTLIIFTGALLAGFKIYAAQFFNLNENILADHIDFVIPLGLSYYTFRCIHYAIEKYKGTIPAHGFEEFAQFMFFLPTFLAGPIHRFHDFQKDINRKRWDGIKFIQGLERILFGYFKIVFIVNLILQNQIEFLLMSMEGTQPWLSSYLVMIQMSLTVYFLFSGASDIAIGFGMLLGIKVMENFNHPYKAKNISDFWRRWHISLTSWCRDYVYMGVMSTARNAALAATAAMLVMGLWHEFSLRYVLWGVYHGVGIAIWQQFQLFKPRLPAINNKHALKWLSYGSTILTLHYFMFGLVLVQHDTMDEAVEHLKALFLL